MSACARYKPSNKLFAYSTGILHGPDPRLYGIVQDLSELMTRPHVNAHAEGIDMANLNLPSPDPSVVIESPFEPFRDPSVAVESPLEPSPAPSDVVAPPCEPSPAVATDDGSDDDGSDDNAMVCFLSSFIDVSAMRAVLWCRGEGKRA